VADRPITVLIVDDHAVVREGLRAVLAEDPEFALVGEAANGAEAVDLAASLRPDVVLMDLIMPVMGGVEATQRIRASGASSRVLILTSFVDDQQVRDAIQAGAIGYLLKDMLTPDLLHGVRAAARGNPALHPEAQRRLMQQVVEPPARPPHGDLTERERDVLALIARGRSNKEIAAALGLTEGTVKGYVSAILSKLDVADRTQAALYAVRHGLASGDL
jgi:two-component system, NarL family, response regulator LiaR